MRVLVVLNEKPAGSHPDIYEAFERLVERGIISFYRAYSHLLARSEGMDDSAIAAQIVGLVRETEADLIVWMHTGRLGIDQATLKAIRSMPQRPLMAYWEKDSFHPLFDPMPKPMLEIMRSCDLVFMPCAGPILGTLHRAGVSEVRFAPSTASGSRFLPLWNPGTAKMHDILLVGNHVSSRIPFKTLPGARRRATLVRAFERRFGKRFAVYGDGWTGPSARGKCAFDLQQQLNTSSRIVIGVNNSTYPYVFSNRLPIALACGAPVLYGKNPGFDKVFGRQLAGRFFESIPDALALAEDMLASDDATLLAESTANRSFFEKNLTTELVARHVLLETVASAETHERSPRLEPEEREPGPLWQQIPPLIRRGHRNA